MAVAVRGGNHGSHGAASINGPDGVLIHTCEMKDVWVDKFNMIAHIQAGALNEIVTKKTKEASKSSVAGVYIELTSDFEN